MPVNSEIIPATTPASQGPVRTCSAKIPTPRAMETAGLTASTTGMVAASGPAWKAVWMSSRPTRLAAAMAHSCQEANPATGPRSNSAIAELSRAACTAIAIAAAAAYSDARAGPRTRRAAASAAAAGSTVPASAGSQAASPGSVIPGRGSADTRPAASPAVTAIAPAHSRRPIRRPSKRIEIGRADSSSLTMSGWTRISGPKASATAWST